MSLGYILVMFLRHGNLPWDRDPIQPLDVDDKDPLIFKKTIEYERAKVKWEQDYCDTKCSTTYQQLCGHLPGPWRDYFEYCENLRFEQQPDYEYLRGLFEEPFKNKQFVLDD